MYIGYQHLTDGHVRSLILTPILKRSTSDALRRALSAVSKPRRGAALELIATELPKEAETKSAGRGTSHA